MKERRILKRIVVLLIIASVLLTLVACRQEPSSSMNDFNKLENTVTTTFSFASDDSTEILA